MAYALDTSQYMEKTSGPLTDDKVRRASARGVERWAVSLLDLPRNHPDYVPDQVYRQLEVLARHPLEIQTFTAYDTDDYQRRQAQDVEMLDKIRREYHDVQKHWIDVEEPGFVAGQHAINNQAVDWLIHSFTGVCPTGIYTSNYMWTRCTGNTAQFNFMPLWYAFWVAGGDTLIIQHPFGGWTRAEMHQTLADLEFEGVWCDTNYYEKAPPQPPVVVPPSGWDAIDQGHLTTILNHANAMQARHPQ